MCICVFVFTSSSFPHKTALSTCVFVLYPLPLLHPTQPTKTTVCQPRFIIFSFKVRAFFSCLSHSSVWATLRPCAAALNWYQPGENLRLWINIAYDAFNISLQQSIVTVATSAKMVIVNINSWGPLYFFLFSFALFIRCTKREDWSFFPSGFFLAVLF